MFLLSNFMFDLDHIRIHTLERRECLVRIRQGALLHYNIIMNRCFCQAMSNDIRSAEEKDISLAFTTSCVAKQQNPPRNEKSIILTMYSYFSWEASGDVRCSKTVSSNSSISESETESAKSRSNVFGSS